MTTKGTKWLQRHNMMTKRSKTTHRLITKREIINPKGPKTSLRCFEMAIRMAIQFF